MQLKTYKRVLESTYNVTCEALIKPKYIGEPMVSKVRKTDDRHRMGKALRQSALRRYLNTNVRMSKQVGGRMNAYDEDEDYEVISKRQKPAFASPSGKLVEEPDGFRDDDNYDILKPDSFQYHDMSRRNQRELEDYEDFADLDPDVRTRSGRRQQHHQKKLRSKDVIEKGGARNLMTDPLVHGRERDARHPRSSNKRRKVSYEDEYFFDNEPEEESVLSGLPDNMPMFQHIKHRPELDVERLLGDNVTTSVPTVIGSRATDTAHRTYLFHAD